MKVVLDTNVIVSALLSPSGPPAQLLKAWEQHTFDLVISEALLTECQRVLLYDHVAARHGMSESEVAEVVDGFRLFSFVVEPTESIGIITDDPPDNRVLECAVAGGASYIISGDNHLLTLQEFRGIQILTPAAFLTALEALSE